MDDSKWNMFIFALLNESVLSNINIKEYKETYNYKEQ